MTEIRAQSRPANLRYPNGGFQRKPTLASPTLNILSWVVSCHRTPAESVDCLEMGLGKFQLVAAKLGATASSDAVP